jgi:hypothetical protein
MECGNAIMQGIVSGTPFFSSSDEGRKGKKGRKEKMGEIGYRNLAAIAALLG